jgi:hypothetical protein
VGSIDADLLDIRAGFPELLDPDNYGPAQTFAREARAEGASGIVYPSVRYPGGTCFAAFYPDVMAPPIQARHISYHWDGARIDLIKDLNTSALFAVVP